MAGFELAPTTAKAEDAKNLRTVASVVISKSIGYFAIGILSLAVEDCQSRMREFKGRMKVPLSPTPAAGLRQVAIHRSLHVS